MDPPLEVDLTEALDAQPFGRVDEVADLDRVAGEERDRLEQRAAARVLSRQRLDHPRQLRVEEVDEGARDELGDAPSAALGQDATLDDGALVVALDVLQAWLVEQRSERAVDHPVVP